jgi:hypothetical protein
MNKEENVRIGETYESGAPDSEPAKESLDDTAPIKPSADLELVTRGDAFWTEDRPEAPKPVEKPEIPEASEEPEESEVAEAKEAVSSRVRAALFERDTPAGHAPSLAELARKRKAELGIEAEPPVSSDGAPSRSADWNPDATDPHGLATRESASRPASAPEAAVSVVSRSLDIAFIDGHNLFIPGATWNSGEHLVIQGRTYQLKRKVAKYPISPRLAAYAAGGFVAGCLIMWMVFSGGQVTKGNIFGLVRDGDTGKLLPGVTVAIEDQGKTSQSDPTGMFSFEQLPEGIYTVVATDPIYGQQRRTVTVSEGTASVMLDLRREAVAVVEPPRPEPAQRAPARVAQAAPTTPTEPVRQEAASNTDSRGELAVKASVPNSKIYLDGKMLGVGNAVYSGIRTGEREIRVEHEGFVPWVQKVKIRSGETNRIEPKLAVAENGASEQLTPEQSAAAGRQLLEQKQYAAAAEQLTIAIQGAPRPQFYAWRADAWAGMKNMQAAEADYLAALESFRQSGESSKLDAMLERAAVVVPNSAPLRMAYGDYLYRQRKLQDAVKNYRRAMELGANPAKAEIAIGLAQYAGGSFEEANTSWTLADDASGGTDPHVAGYLALSNARLQYRASCRNAVRRLMEYPNVLAQFRSHPDWDRVRHLTGEG